MLFACPQCMINLRANPWRFALVVDYLQSKIAVVFQDTYLFHGTIEENLHMAQPDADENTVIAAARSAGAHDFILALPAGYQTIIGERGATLSGGERQRLAIARAILKDAPLLILDEATSSVDAKSEALILLLIASMKPYSLEMVLTL